MLAGRKAGMQKDIQAGRKTDRKSKERQAGKQTRTEIDR